MTGRNDPCPCGSGKKYKKCCLLRDHASSVQATSIEEYSFSPGSFGGAGTYYPSIACKKHSEFKAWQYHFVLAKLEELHQDEESACRSAEDDLEIAFQANESGGRENDVANHLKSVGYSKIEDYQIAKKDENG